jgi:hypothetical protein
MKNTPQENRPWDLPLTREQFRSALQKGHGRALMHAQGFGVTGMEDLVVEACRHNQAYDPQCEGDRADWMTEIIEASGAEERVVPQALEGLQVATGDNRFWDLNQLCRLARIFAGRGREDARRALYGAFQKDPDTMDLIGGEEIVDLDGADGLIHLADRMGSWLIDQPDLALDDRPVQWFDDRHGEGAGIRVLEACGYNNELVAVYLRHMLQSSDQNPEAHSTRRLDQIRLRPDAGDDHVSRMKSYSAEDIIHEIQTTDPESNRYWFSSWGRHATEDQLLAITAKMFTEENAGRLVKYLRVFLRRELPQFDARLIPLAQHPNADVRWTAIRVLANHEHPGVRELAIARIQAGLVSEGELQLLRRNYRAGDHLLVANVFQVPEDQENLHDLVLDLAKVYETNQLPEARQSMLFVYEHSPCGNCRSTAVEVLLRTDQAPEWLIRECAFDSNTIVREAASKR